MPRLLLGAAALALVLAGCGGDPESTPSPEVTLTTPVDASPSASPAPTLPAAAQADTKAGAIAFVKHYVELINHAQANGDLQHLAAVESMSCKSCTNGREYLGSIYSAGGHIEGGNLSIKIDNAIANMAVDGWTIDGRLSFGAQVIVRPEASTPTQHLSGGGVPVTVLVSYEADGWRVSDWTRAR